VATERWEPVPHGGIADFYRAVAASNGVVLMTSRSEGFGNVAVEAAACGARVAAPDVMGLREAVVDGETGMLFPAAASDDEVADRISRWLESPHDMARCADSARRAFSAETMVDRYAAIYERAQQRLHTDVGGAARVHESDAPGMQILEEHLGRQRRWRATVARQAAAELARAGYRREALRVLADGFRAVPTQLLSATALRQLARAGAGLALPQLRQA
jgi:hypothetical protein